jgi:prepilin-type N-terminal cleavage/methylation domain-containing protein
VSERGFTAVEVLIAAVLFGVLLAGVASALVSDTQASRVLLAHLGPEIRATTALDRITSDLRMAGEWGEDRNHDGVMQEGEDTNENGVLDADWSLPDLAANQPSITFNRRIDMTDETGTLVRSGIYSRPVTYRIVGTDLVREWVRTLPDGSTQTLRAVMASRVRALRFSRAGQLVTVQLDIELPPAISRTGFRTLTSRVWLRN